MQLATPSSRIKTYTKQSRPTELTTHDKYLTYTYDSHGRVLYKTQTPLKDGKPLQQSGNAIVGFRNSLQLAYNADHELTQSISITQQGIDTTVITTDYHYDAFGRHTHKHSETKHKSRRHSSGKLLIKPVQTSKTKQQHTSYLWDGNRQIQQNTATHTHTIIYEQDSFEPVAQLIWLRDGLTAANDEPKTNDEGWYGNNKPVIKTGVQLYHYHNDHLGTPNELTDQQGDVVWYADYEAWGNTAKVEWREQVIDNVKVSKDELQPIRFQGQSFDTETGLHYNRFRYFDPDMGMFATRDPIGLMGGSNVFQYAPNPTGWIDPFGLKKKCLTYNHIRKPNKKTNISELRKQIRGQIAAMNRIIKEEGMVGLKNRIRNYNPSIRKEGDEFIRKLGSAGKGKAWLHEPDMRVGGLPTDVTRSGDSRINSIIGGQANRLAEDILKMPDDTTGLKYKLKTK